MAAAAVGLDHVTGLHRGNNVCGGRGESGADMNKGPTDRLVRWMEGFQIPNTQAQSLA
jgi:hypothetical protein